MSENTRENDGDGWEEPRWTEVWYGKHSGRTLPEIVLRDPDWFFWVMDKGGPGGIPSEEAAEIDAKARSIKLPDGIHGEQVVSYLEGAYDHKLHGVELVPRDRPLHVGSGKEHRSDFIDLSLARKLCSYDKTGGKKLVTFLKEKVFGNSCHYLTRERCEAFFDNDNNFGVSQELPDGAHESTRSMDE